MTITAVGPQLTALGNAAFTCPGGLLAAQSPSIVADGLCGRLINGFRPFLDGDEGSSADLATLHSAFDDTHAYLRAIISGRAVQPPEEELDALLEPWFMSLEPLQGSFASESWAPWRRLAWSAHSTLREIVPLDRGLKVLMRLDDPDLSHGLAKFSSLDVSFQNGDFSQLTNGTFDGAALRLLTECGLLPNVWEEAPETRDGEYYWPPNGKSEYVSVALRSAFDSALEYLSVYIKTKKQDSARENLSYALMRFLDLRRLFPSAPYRLLVSIVAMNLFEENETSPAFSYNVVANMVIGMARYLASLPERDFAWHQEQMAIDFPEALILRNGLSQEIDRDAITKTLAFPQDGEELVMHLSVGNDLELVRESLLNLKAGGRVIIVDADANVFDAYLADKELEAAIKNGRLVTMRDNYNENDTLGAYDGKVTRLYAVNLVGTPHKLFTQLVAPGGLLVYGASDVPEGQQYNLFDRPIFVSGAFERLAGYSMGPAWFNTETDRQYHGVGIKLAVGKKQ